MMLKLSQLFIDKLRLSNEPGYKLAWRAGFHPSLLSKWRHGAEHVRLNDPRIIAVGVALGLRSDECFETIGEEPHSSAEHREKTRAGALPLTGTVR